MRQQKGNSLRSNRGLSCRDRMAGGLLTSCAQKADSLETVRIGGMTQPVAGLVYVADEKGFFKQRGVM